jgi:hypothetical protein
LLQQRNLRPGAGNGEEIRLRAKAQKQKQLSLFGGYPLHLMTARVTARQRGEVDRPLAWSCPGLATADDCDDGEEVSKVGLRENVGLRQMGCPEAPEILHNQEEGGNVGRWFVLRVPRHAHLLRHPNELS